MGSEEDMAVAAEEDAGDTDKDKETRSFKHQQHIKEIKIFTNLVSVYLTSALGCNVKRIPMQWVFFFALIPSRLHLHIFVVSSSYSSTY